MCGGMPRVWQRRKGLGPKVQQTAVKATGWTNRTHVSRVDSVLVHDTAAGGTETLKARGAGAGVQTRGSGGRVAGGTRTARATPRAGLHSMQVRIVICSGPLTLRYRPRADSGCDAVPTWCTCARRHNVAAHHKVGCDVGESLPGANDCMGP